MSTLPPGSARPILDDLKQLGSATVYEGLGRYGALDAAIKPLDPHRRLAGPALTVASVPGDNLAIHYAMTLAQPGDVLVVDAGGYLEAGAWGDVLTAYAQHRGLAGLVIDGAVRDTSDIIAMGFPVFARGASIKGTGKDKAGTVGSPISCGGVLVSPGDIVLGDADGVAIVPAARAEEAVRKAKDRHLKEEAMRGAIAEGSHLADLLEVRSAFARLGYTRS